MAEASFLTRLGATLFQSPDQWTVLQDSAGTIIARDKLTTPYLTPMTLVALMFLAYEAYVCHVGFTIGWRGIEALAAPGFLLLFLGFASHPVVRVERLIFDRRSRHLTIEGLRGKARVSRRWAYRNIRYLRVVRPPINPKVRVTDLVVIAGDSDKDRVQIETMAHFSGASTEEIFAAIAAALPDHVVKDA